MDRSFTAENPFSAQRVRPGGIQYLFSPGQNVEMLVDRLRQTGWRGEIIGPHGSGKSTLLETLIPALERAGRPVALIALHDGQRWLPRESLRLSNIKPRPVVAPCGATAGRGFKFDAQKKERADAPAILAVDGYEQLGYWSRWTLKRFCRRRGMGLLVTAHESMGFPPLYQTAVTPELADQVVGKLLEGRSPPFSFEEVSQCLSKHGGDLRETLFELYDVFEHF